MATIPQLLKTIALSALILTVEGRPSCKFYGDLQKDLICTTGSGDEDYTLKRGLVSDNNRTTGITLRGCRINSIHFESFNGLFGLQYLDISENKIQELKLGVLDGAKQVTYLNISHNRLRALPLGLFDQKPNLEVLDLKGNEITSLKRGIFDPFSKLRHLDLSSNSFFGSDLSPYLLEKSKRIDFMDFSRNDMSGAPENLLHAFQAINFLNLDRCSLTEVPKFATNTNLKTMKHLMLSTNRISKIDNPAIFIGLENLEILNLAENVIESVNENVFKPLRKLEMIVLRNNKLVDIPDTLFKDMTKLINIDLSHNLIKFVPVNAFRGSKVKNLNIADNRFTYLTDNFLLELKNSGTIVKKFFFNQNPWQCACLKDILNEVKVLGIQYNSAKYDGKTPVCVTNEFTCKRHQNFNDQFVEMYYNIINT